MGVAGQHSTLTANDFSQKEKLSEEMWNAVQPLLVCDVIQEKESMHFNKTGVILVIRFLILVLSLQSKGATQSTAQLILL